MIPFFTLILCLFLNACHVTPLFIEEEFRHVINDIIDQEERSGHDTHVDHLEQIKQDHDDHTHTEDH